MQLHQPDASAQVEAVGMPSATTPPTFMVRTTTRGDLLVGAGDVERIAAQGNYIALHGGTETHLLRHTLTEMEARLKGAVSFAPIDVRSSTAFG